MAQRKRNHANKAGHRVATGCRGGKCAALHSVETAPAPMHAPHDSGSVWGRRRVLLLNSTYEPLTALPMRRAIVMLLCGKAEVVHDDPTGPVIHSATPRHRGAVGDPAAGVRPGALPGAHSDDPGGIDAPRPVPLRVLRRQSRHRRPRGAAQPRRRAHLGELRGVLFDLQPPQGRQAAGGAGMDVADVADATEGPTLAVAVDGQGTRPGVGPISG